MKSILKSVLVLFLLVFISGCMEVIEIDGKREIRTDESYVYKALIVSTEYKEMDSYQWKVVSKHKDYNLTNETTSEVIFTAHSAGKYTLKVIANKNRKPFKDSIEIEVTEPEVINGYILPPEPDEKLNNSTLLGIDSNNNGVRDDVEIYVIKRYAKDPEFPKTKTALAMQYVWAEQQIIDNPVIESRKFMTDSIDCETYWFHQKQKEINQKIIELGETNFDEAIQETIKAGKWRQEHSVFNDTAINDKIYNTRERIERSFEFNQACSGHIFDGREAKLDYCHTNLDELGE